MRFKDNARLWLALTAMGIDNGGHADPEAAVPASWEDRVREAEAQMAGLTPEQIDELVMGEGTDSADCAFPATEADHLRRDCPMADEVLSAAFDGELTFALRPWENAFGQIKAARDHDAAKGQL